MIDDVLQFVCGSDVTGRVVCFVDTDFLVVLVITVDVVCSDLIGRDRRLTLTGNQQSPEKQTPKMKISWWIFIQNFIKFLQVILQFRNNGFL